MVFDDIKSCVILRCLENVNDNDLIFYNLHSKFNTVFHIHFRSSFDSEKQTKLVHFLSSASPSWFLKLPIDKLRRECHSELITILR